MGWCTSPSPRATVLESPSAARHIVTANGRILWLTPEGVMAADPDGRNKSLVLACPEPIGLDREKAHWVEDGTLKAAWLGSDLVRVVARGVGWVDSLVVCKGVPVWIDPRAGAIVAAIDGLASTIVRTPQARALAAGADALYWTEGAGWGDGRIVRTDLTSRVSTRVATRQRNPVTISTYGDAVYWTNWESPARGSVMGLSTSHGTVENLREDVDPGSVTADASGVYWTTADAVECRLTSDRSVRALSVVATGSSVPMWIALDDTYVYWTSSPTEAWGSSSLMRFTKKDFTSAARVACVGRG